MDTIGPPKLEIKGKALLIRYIENIPFCEQHAQFTASLIARLEDLPIPPDLDENTIEDFFATLIDSNDFPELNQFGSCKDWCARESLQGLREMTGLLDIPQTPNEDPTLTMYREMVGVALVTSATDLNNTFGLRRTPAELKQDQVGLDRAAQKSLQDIRTGDRVVGGPIWDLPEEE